MSLRPTWDKSQPRDILIKQPVRSAGSDIQPGSQRSADQVVWRQKRLFFEGLTSLYPGLELPVTLLPQPPKQWTDRHPPPRPAKRLLVPQTRTQSTHLLRKAPEPCSATIGAVSCHRGHPVSLSQATEGSSSPPHSQGPVHAQRRHTRNETCHHGNLDLDPSWENSWTRRPEARPLPHICFPEPMSTLTV